MAQSRGVANDGAWLAILQFFMQPNKIQQMFRDTLIAVSVSRTHALLVTNNVSDFEGIQRYGKLRIQSGAISLPARATVSRLCGASFRSCSRD